MIVECDLIHTHYTILVCVEYLMWVNGEISVRNALV